MINPVLVEVTVCTATRKESVQANEMSYFLMLTITVGRGGAASSVNQWIHGSFLSTCGVNFIIIFAVRCCLSVELLSCELPEMTGVYQRWHVVSEEVAYTSKKCCFISMHEIL